MSNIPDGYRLTITSWENDGDYYRDCIFDGLNEADTKYLIALASLFRSMNNSTDGFGGAQHHYAHYKRGTQDLVFDIATAMNKVTDEHPDASEHYKEMFLIALPAEPEEEVDDEGWRDAVHEATSGLVSTAGEGYGDMVYFRVFDHFTVHHYETEVKDVTEAFTHA